MVDQDTSTDSFIEFVREAEPRLRHALCAAFGADLGRESAAHALAYGWEHWDRIRGLDNPAGYLWGVGRNHARRQRKRRLIYPEPPADSMPWVEPGLTEALASLSERQRLTVLLVHGLGWSLSEVGTLLEVSKSTVQTQLERGMARLRKQIGVDDAI